VAGRAGGEAMNRLSWNEESTGSHFDVSYEAPLLFAWANGIYLGTATIEDGTVVPPPAHPYGDNPAEWAAAIAKMEGRL
jgi:hypothetical protein